MILNRHGKITWTLAALVVFTGTAIAAPATCQTASSTGQSREAAKLLADIRMDARQVRAHSWRWAMLAEDQTATWYNFDKQWNEIQFPVKDMSAKLVRLEDMGPNLPLWEQKAIAGSKPLIADIAGKTHSLRTQLNQYYANLSNPLSSTITGDDSRVLARDAGRLLRIVERPQAT